MKLLIIGGNRFVGLRLALEADRDRNIELHVLNRTGQVPHLKRAAIYKGDRKNLKLSGLDTEYDAIVDFACFDDLDAQSALNHFKKVGRYILISSLSVYDSGASLKESDFKAETWVPSGPPPADVGAKYQDGKRRAENLFTKQNAFPFVAVRFPFILGPDDYTRRLEFHVQRVERNQTLFVPNPQARISFIHAEDASRFLKWSLAEKLPSALNVASPEPLSLRSLLSQIESRVGQKALLVQSPSPQNYSPYSPREDYFLDVSKVEQLGFKARPISEWMTELIDGAREAPPSQTLH